MAELIPAPFGHLVTRLFREPAAQDALFELPRRRWYLPAPDGPDLSVRCHGLLAGNPAGPAAGPHTQMAQNLLLSYAAGGRMLELKTVQVNDRLTIPRPCIDMTNVGYNVEWSQELRVEDALREYVAGAMLIEMFRRNRDLTNGLLEGPAGEVIFELSVGYDLAGIRTDKIRRFLDGARDARGVVEGLRAQIPPAFAAARDQPYSTRLAESVTLSTFHGCPAEEVEHIGEFLIAEHDFNVILKMNPPMLGRERLEHLLYDVMGYSAVRVSPQAYESGVRFEEALQICNRLTRFAKQRGRRLGLKFSNTLEVLNHRHFFSPDNQTMYLSGRPLHVITMALTDEFRRRAGPDVPISFSAGIDRRNFPLAVACGFVPVTVVTDLLRPGGYGRLPAQLDSLAQEMRDCGAATVDQYILRRFGQEDEAQRRAAAELCDNANSSELKSAAVRWAGLLNTRVVAELARDDPRYRAEKNSRVPKKLDSHLKTFDCLTCDKCLAVCPNAALFKYPTTPVAFDYHDIIVSPDGRWRQGPRRRFEIVEPMQIAYYADFCNECGNCATFCPEHGGPHVEKPRFFGSIESWQRAAPRDGVVLERTEAGDCLHARISGEVYKLAFDRAADTYCFDNGVVEAVLAGLGHEIASVEPVQPANAEHTLDLGVYHTLRCLRTGVLARQRVNQVNVGMKVQQQ